MVLVENRPLLNKYLQRSILWAQTKPWLRVQVKLGRFWDWHLVNRCSLPRFLLFMIGRAYHQLSCLVTETVLWGEVASKSNAKKILLKFLIIVKNLIFWKYIFEYGRGKIQIDPKVLSKSYVLSFWILFHPPLDERACSPARCLGLFFTQLRHFDV